MNGSSQIWVGETGCGKGTLAKSYITRCPGFPTVIMCRDNDWNRRAFTNYKEWKKAATAAHDSIVILDEFDSYIRPEKSAADLELIGIMTSARKKNNFVIIIGHTFFFLGEWVVSNANALRRWNTGDLSLTPYYRRYAAKRDLVNSLITRPVLKQYESIFIPLR